jgi:(p)ppGpp synthase/HD superfamily hydrolase
MQSVATGETSERVGSTGGMARVNDAMEFAARKHTDQRRKYSAEPYLTHLQAVVAILEEHGVDQPEVLSAAYLHDTVENTGTTIPELVEAFGETVAELVFWLTDNEKSNQEAQTTMSAWRFGRAPWHAKLIKLADIIDNARNAIEHDPKSARLLLAEKKQVLAQMARWEGQRLEVLPLFKTASLLVSTPETGRAEKSGSPEVQR